MSLIIQTPFGFSLDLSFWQEILNLPTRELIISIMAIAGWTALALVFFLMGKELWAAYRQGKHTANWKYILLAVDIPPLFVQSPKAVEQIFAHLSGALSGIKLKDKYWKGKKQKAFSLEVISIEGYIQFLIRTEAEFRDLVEAAIYAQYPEAEITEVEDYVNNVPSTFPDEEYDMVGIEFKLEQEDAYPLRTYPNFEYSISKDAVFSDPMAAILENFSRVGHGENLWFHIIVEPTGNDWKEKGIALVKSIIENKKTPPKPMFINKIADIPLWAGKQLVKIWNWDFSAEEKAAEAPAGKLSDLTPGKKSTVEAIEDKISKIGFKTKFYLLYVARKEVFNPSKCIGGFIGALNQFNVLGRNSIVPYKDTKKNKEKNAFFAAFKKRKLKTRGQPFILNIEELATVWHFPLPFVKTPLLQKANIKRAEPPIDLPVETLESPLKKVGEEKPEPGKEKQEQPPDDLPYA